MLSQCTHKRDTDEEGKRNIKEVPINDLVARGTLNIYIPINRGIRLKETTMENGGEVNLLRDLETLLESKPLKNAQQQQNTSSR